MGTGGSADVLADPSSPSPWPHNPPPNIGRIEVQIDRGCSLRSVEGGAPCVRSEMSAQPAFLAIPKIPICFRSHKFPNSGRNIALIDRGCSPRSIEETRVFRSWRSSAGGAHGCLSCIFCLLYKARRHNLHIDPTNQPLHPQRCNSLLGPGVRRVTRNDKITRSIRVGGIIFCHRVSELDFG